MEDHRQSTSQAGHSERHVLLKKKVKNCTKAIYKPTQPLQTRLHRILILLTLIYLSVMCPMFLGQNLALFLVCYGTLAHHLQAIIHNEKTINSGMVGQIMLPSLMAVGPSANRATTARVMATSAILLMLTSIAFRCFFPNCSPGHQQTWRSTRPGQW
jgi:hypothetical protein